MKQLKKVFAVALLLMLCALCCVALADAAQTEERTHQDVLDEWAQLMLDRAEKYAPQIRTLSNGVQIQRTPTEYKVESNSNVAVPGGTVSYNNRYLNADSRGCTACHADMKELVTTENLGYLHTELDSEFDIAITYKDCYYCHTYIGSLYSTLPFKNLIHGLHMNSNAFTAMGGDCFSCHFAQQDGTLAIWDDVKYEELWGIRDVESEQVQGDFVYDQTFTGSADSLFTFKWLLSADNLESYIPVELGEQLELSVYDTWTISITGLVEEEKSYTISELLEKFPTETFTGVFHCIDNPVGGPYITQLNMTGISFEYLLEDCGVKEGATGVSGVMSSHSVGSTSSFEHIEKFGYPFIVLQVDGEPLGYENGFPAMIYMPGMPADHHNRGVIGLEVQDLPVEDYAPPTNYWISYKPWFPQSVMMPNAGIFELPEGRIIEAYEPYTFEGYADNFWLDIRAVEFSFDQGETWKSFDTSDTKAGRWVHWTFTWTPPEEGAYVIMVRAIDENGDPTPFPVKYMVNAKVQ